MYSDGSKDLLVSYLNFLFREEKILEVMEKNRNGCKKNKKKTSSDTKNNTSKKEEKSIREVKEWVVYFVSRP